MEKKTFADASIWIHFTYEQVKYAWRAEIHVRKSNENNLHFTSASQWHEAAGWTSFSGVFQSLELAKNKNKKKGKSFVTLLTKLSSIDHKTAISGFPHDSLLWERSRDRRRLSKRETEKDTYTWRNRVTVTRHTKMMENTEFVLPLTTTEHYYQLYHYRHNRTRFLDHGIRRTDPSQVNFGLYVHRNH